MHTTYSRQYVTKLAKNGTFDTLVFMGLFAFL